MPKFSNKSKEKLVTCDIRLQNICHEAIKIMDFSVICGYRDEEAQNSLFEKGMTKAKWGESEHNNIPAKAVDLLPYPSGWDDKYKLYELAGVIGAVAFSQGVKIKWGRDFKSFFDGAHFELM